MKKLYLYMGTGLVTTMSAAHAVTSTIAPSVNCCMECVQYSVDNPVQYTFSPLCNDGVFCDNCTAKGGNIVMSLVGNVCTPSCQQLPVITTCSQGQYNNNGVCTACPDGGTTSGRWGGFAITDCYLAKGTTLTDASGTYVYTDDCHYSLAS